jgi:hypothetical protein
MPRNSFPNLSFYTNNIINNNNLVSHYYQIHNTGYFEPLLHQQQQHEPQPFLPLNRSQDAGVLDDTTGCDYLTTPLQSAQIITIDDSSEGSHNNSNKIYGQCKVCTEEANGIHYGVATCEGCKVCS